VGVYFMISVLVATLIFAFALILSVFLYTRSKTVKIGKSSEEPKKEEPKQVPPKQQAVPGAPQAGSLYPETATSPAIPPREPQYQPATQPMLQPAQQQPVYNPAPPQQQDLDNIFSGKSPGIDDLFEG
jgi:hypothetical protein